MLICACACFICSAFVLFLGFQGAQCHVFKKTFGLRIQIFLLLFCGWEESVNGEENKSEKKQPCSGESQDTSPPAEVPSTTLYSRMNKTSF